MVVCEMIQLQWMAIKNKKMTAKMSQLLAALIHSAEVLGCKPLPVEAVVLSLNALTVFLWVSFRCLSFLPQSADMQAR